MSATIMDFRVREEMAGAVLKEVATLEPAERLREVQPLTHLVGEAVKDLEEHWEDLREQLQGGVSLSDAATLALTLTRSANLIGSSVELLVGESLLIGEFRKTNLARLQRIKECASSLREFAEMTSPAPDPERLRRSLEQLDRNEGVAADELLPQSKR
jgi:hypothetical protein